MRFIYQLHSGPEGHRLSLSGDIEFSTCEELRRILADLVNTSGGDTYLDLRDVTFLDCAVVGEFIRAYTDAQRRGHRFTVNQPQGIVRRMLELTEVLPLLTRDRTAVMIAGS
jgi:anti-anti-sigma factor